MRRLEAHQKVFGVGLSKTGTTSLTEALNLLGVRTIHNPHDGATQRALERADLRLPILEQYQGVTDIPVAPYYAQLDQEYPGSKFILTVRDESSWIRSSRKHWELMPSWEADTFYRFLHAVVYGCLEFNEERFRFAYRTHRRNVIDYFRGRPDDFLVFDLVAGEGWDELCPFLGLPQPPVPFPHRNTIDETARWAQRLRKALAEIDAVLPPGEVSVILADEQEFGHLLIRGRRPIPFLERDGVYWGRPTDGESGVRELERLRAAGARYVVLAWPAFWWLDFYHELARHLRTSCRLLSESEQVMIFELASGAYRT